jgi:myo-inositol 2-dehydrogenase / D-chiro-inositol 1-dehydrogenase
MKDASADRSAQNEKKSTAGSSRRDFLKTSTTLAAGGALAGSLGSAFAATDIARVAHPSSDETIRIALIGCGGRGTEACSQALSTKEGPIKLVAMADAFEDRLESSLRVLKFGHPKMVDVPKERRFIGFDAYKKVIDSDIDMLVIATPPGFRPIHFEAAVKAGKNIFMEKPLSTDANGIRRVLASAQEAKQKGLKVGVGLQRHHDAKYIETIKRLHDGAIGDIVSMRVYWNNPGVWVKPRLPGMTEMEYQMRNWYYFVWLCGDHIVEQHIHNLDVAHWVKRALPIKATGMGGRQVRTGKEYGEIYDHHDVQFEYADGSYVFSQCRHQPGTWDIVDEFAQGTNGMSRVGQGHIDIKGWPEWKYEKSVKNAYQVEHDDLQKAIRENRPYNEVEYAAHSTMMAIMGRYCTYTGQELTWDQCFNNDISVMPKEFTFQSPTPTNPDSEGFYAIPMPGQNVRKFVS